MGLRRLPHKEELSFQKCQMTRFGEKASFHFQSILSLVHTSDAKSSYLMDRDSHLKRLQYGEF